MFGKDITLLEKHLYVLIWALDQENVKTSDIESFDIVVLRRMFAVPRQGIQSIGADIVWIQEKRVG